MPEPLLRPPPTQTQTALPRRSDEGSTSRVQMQMLLLLMMELMSMERRGNLCPPRLKLEHGEDDTPAFLVSVL